MNAREFKDTENKAANLINVDGEKLEIDLDVFYGFAEDYHQHQLAEGDCCSQAAIYEQQRILGIIKEARKNNLFINPLSVAQEEWNKAIEFFEDVLIEKIKG